MKTTNTRANPKPGRRCSVCDAKLGPEEYELCMECEAELGIPDSGQPRYDEKPEEDQWR